MAAKKKKGNAWAICRSKLGTDKQIVRKSKSKVRDVRSN